MAVLPLNSITELMMIQIDASVLLYKSLLKVKSTTIKETSISSIANAAQVVFYFYAYLLYCTFLEK